MFEAASKERRITKKKNKTNNKKLTRSNVKSSTDKPRELRIEVEKQHIRISVRDTM